MSHLIIDISGEQHKKSKLWLPCRARPRGDYVLDRQLPRWEAQSWEELKTVLKA